MSNPYQYTPREDQLVLWDEATGVKLYLEMYTVMPFFHFVWPPEASITSGMVKRFKKKWDVLLGNIKLYGHRKVYCMVPASDQKLIRFEKLWGMEPEREVDINGHKFVLMSRGI